MRSGPAITDSFSEMPLELIIQVSLYLNSLDFFNTSLISKKYYTAFSYIKTAAIFKEFFEKQQALAFQKNIVNNVLGLKNKTEVNIIVIRRNNDPLSVPIDHPLTQTLNEIANTHLSVTVYDLNYIDTPEISLDLLSKDRATINKGLICWIHENDFSSSLDISRIIMSVREYNPFILCFNDIPSSVGDWEYISSFTEARLETRKDLLNNYFSSVISYFKQINQNSAFCYETIIEINDKITQQKIELKELNHRRNTVLGSIDRSSIDKKIETITKKIYLLEQIKPCLQKLIHSRQTTESCKSTVELVKLFINVDPSLIEPSSGTGKIVLDIDRKFVLGALTFKKKNCVVM